MEHAARSFFFGANGFCAPARPKRGPSSPTRIRCLQHVSLANAFHHWRAIQLHRERDSRCSVADVLARHSSYYHVMQGILRLRLVDLVVTLLEINDLCGRSFPSATAAAKYTYLYIPTHATRENSIIDENKTTSHLACAALLKMDPSV